MTNKLVVIINSLKVPKVKKIVLFEMKFLVPNYSRLQNPWLGGYRPQIPVLSVLCPQLNSLNPTRNKIPGYATGQDPFVRITGEPQASWHSAWGGQRTQHWYLDRKNKVAGMMSGWASVRWVATMARKWMSVAPRLDRTQRLRLQKLPVGRTSRLQAIWWHGVTIPIKQSSTTASRKSHETFHIHFKRDEIICGKKYYKLCTVFSYRGVVYLLYMLHFTVSCVYCC